MSKSAKTGSNFGGQNFASFRRKHELFLGSFFGCHEISENSAPVLVGEAGASVRARKSLKKRTSTDRHKSPGNVGSGLLSAFGAIKTTLPLVSDRSDQRREYFLNDENHPSSPRSHRQAG